MPDPAIRAGGHQRVFLSDDDGTRQVFPEAPEGPDEQTAGDDPQTAGTPASPSLEGLSQSSSPRITVLRNRALPAQYKLISCPSGSRR